SIWSAARQLAGIEAAAALPSVVRKIRIRPGSGEMGRDASEFRRNGQNARGAIVSTPPMNQLPPLGKSKDKFTPELRILVASLLSMAVILLWAKFFGPKPPVNPPQENQPAQVSTATPGTTAPANAPAAAPT